ncbi:MAG TPA: hypothetical protein VE988_18815 [Gemmataceae bacterium]|nr:hypothetical protein [Gemmataceae bacterium]
MSEKANGKFKISRLQRLVVEDITDPAEQARLDEVCKRERRRLREEEARMIREAEEAAAKATAK